MTQLKAINTKFRQMLIATKELRELADAKGVCPHCIIHDIVDTSSISELSELDKESINNAYNIAEDRRKELIEMLTRFDPSLAV